MSTGGGAADVMQGRLPEPTDTARAVQHTRSAASGQWDHSPMPEEVPPLMSDLQRLPPGAIAQAFHVEESRVGFDTFDLVRQ